MIQKLILPLILISSNISWADSLRREPVFQYEPSHFIYPVAGKVPGLGQSSGLGATVNNIGGSDIDITAVKMDGDFDVTVFSVLNVHLLKERIIFDAGYFQYDVATQVFNRGQESSKDEYILPTVLGKGHFAQIMLQFQDRMFELYARTNQSNNQLLHVYNKDGEKFDNIDTEKKWTQANEVGITIDLTDHRYDPRQGFRLEHLVKLPQKQDDSLVSEFKVIDTNLSAYIPMGERSTWAFNYFQSDAHITEQSEADSNTLRQNIGMNCSQIQDSMIQTECLKAEDQVIQERLDYNTYGRATPIGGSQRLRAFPNGRFYAGHSRYIGTEFRWNLNDEKSSFNYIIMKGVRTGFQLAAFYGQGGVNDQISELKTDLKSYGIGGRVILQGGTVFRIDYATGDEGSQTTVFVDYPWSMNPIDNSSK